MMRSTFRLTALSALAVGTLALGACSGDKKGETGAEAGASDAKPAAGRYETTMKIVKMDMPGMPPEMQAAMKEQLGKGETSISCLTKEEAAKADESFFKPPSNGDDGCKYSNFKIGGGKVSAEAVCEQGPAKQNMKMEGAYSADGYSMSVKADGSMGEQKVSMEMEMDAKRTGDCDGTEKS